MEDRLQQVFKNINEWLRYAEAKSATLLAANGVTCFGLIRIFQNADNSHIWLMYYGLFVLVLLITSMIFLLVSFSPSLDIPWLFKRNEPNDSDNLFYFEHAAKYSPLQYLRSLAVASNLEKYECTDVERMLAKQIIANSVIARRKYIIFNIAVWLSISAILTPLLAWWVKGRSH